MAKGVVPAIAIAMTIPAILPARSDDIPALNVQPVCRGIASQSADPLEAGLQDSFAQCVQSEREVREQLKKAWPTFSAADKQHCVTLAKIGGGIQFHRAPHMFRNGPRCTSKQVYI
jgi:hypothetical protein